jgi:hypothetical protein
MARLKSEIEVVCPCCQSTLVIDVNLGRVISHPEPERGDQRQVERLVEDQLAARSAMRGDFRSP